MSETFKNIKVLVSQRRVLVSVHAFQRMAKRDILPTEVIAGITRGEVIEDYPNYHVGPAVLVLQSGINGEPLHAVWGIEKGSAEPAVLVTAYRPDPSEWTPDFRKRIA